jgi:hypothetical protein
MLGMGRTRQVFPAHLTDQLITIQGGFPRFVPGVVVPFLQESF